jgi:hypothetical protein
VGQIWGGLTPQWMSLQTKQRQYFFFIGRLLIP